MVISFISYLAEHLEKKVDNGQRLWLLCNSEIWYRMYIDGMSKDDFREVLSGLVKGNVS